MHISIHLKTHPTQVRKFMKKQPPWNIIGRGPRWSQPIGWCWRDTQISRKRLAVQFPAVKCSLYLIENLPGGQLPPMLWRWLVGILSTKMCINNMNGLIHPKLITNLGSMMLIPRPNNLTKKISKLKNKVPNAFTLYSLEWHEFSAH